MATLPGRFINMDYSGFHYGTPRDTMNDLIQATTIEFGRHDLLTEAMFAEPVPYIYLYWL